ncbi:AP2/ERF domain-containing protein PFD0985w [Plodia interpunctella]|uniref:AP2/ERF domain-containing protein PFD0985w n=1 Tax=Plodia interpunctella TaxID=58824 RepID=UPI0023684375|nr:AP2/ERF domain-containing protein PFD0985w [Plodia interpunctella]
MDLKGSLIDTNVRIYPSKKLRDFIKTIAVNRATPYNIAKIAKSEEFTAQNITESVLQPSEYELNNKDIVKINKIKNIVKSDESSNIEETEVEPMKENNVNHNNNQNEKSKNIRDDQNVNIDSDGGKDNKKPDDGNSLNSKESLGSDKSDSSENSEIYRDEQYLVTNDIDWLYKYLKEKRGKGDKNVPFLHVLLEGVDVVMPGNTFIKRNPVLEERCVKLRAQQEAREYRKMTKSVDNVRIRFPEDTISYQMKQLNRQLIAIGQFVLSIFAGFLFGFKGVEWMIGPMEFGFRLLLGVMCALIIALAEIYFLAKKLNEELNVPETVQLGGPTKFAEEPTCHGHKISKFDKEHMD